MIMFKGINTPKDVSNVTNPLMSVVHLDKVERQDKTFTLKSEYHIAVIRIFPICFYPDAGQ